MDTYAIDLTAQIPGLTFRNLRDAEDYEALAQLIEASHLADGDEWLPDGASLRVELEHEAGFDPRMDVLFAEVHGELVGYVQSSRQVRDGVAVYTTVGTVHPGYRRRGLGRTLLRRSEARLRDIATRHAEDSERAYGSWTGDREAGARELLTSEGYRPVRYGFAMIRGDLERLPDARLPGGLEMRPVEPDHLRPIFDATNEAFRDHWGHRESTDEDFEGLVAMPNLDPTLWRVAWDGDEVAGSVQTFVWHHENEKLGVRRGWFETISVRRPWRRQGLARALIVEAMKALREADLAEAMLGVDAENPSGALHLYEDLGFTVKDSGTTYRKSW